MALIENNFETQEYKINFGPAHPSTHGSFRAVLTLNGEEIVKLENNIGYLHRGIEKLAESRTYAQFAAFTPRLDYLAGALNNWAYVVTVEKLMEIEVPQRAEYIRVLTGELQRIASHFILIASSSIDLGATTAWMYAISGREVVLDLLEMVTGSRMMPAFYTIGGVMDDLPDQFIPGLKKAIPDLLERVKDIDDMVAGNEIYQARTKGVGVITPEKAIEFGITGPNLRAAGISYDLRKIAPYSVYDKFDFDIPVLKNGDCYDRFRMRILEIQQSIRIIEQAMASLPEGPITAKVPKVIKPPVGEVYAQIESSKGIMGFYIVSDGSTKPYRLHVHSPSFTNMMILEDIAVGGNVQDFIATLATTDFSMGEVDR